MLDNFEGNSLILNNRAVEEGGEQSKNMPPDLKVENTTIGR